MAKRERHAERVRILRVLDGEMTGLQIAEATGLNRRSIGQKLQSMSLDGLVDCRPSLHGLGSGWRATDKGRRVLAESAAPGVRTSDTEEQS